MIERNTTPIPPSASFVCFDVVALYTNMPVSLTVQLVCARFAKFYGVPIVHKSVAAVSKLLFMLFTDNIFVVPAYGELGEPVAFTQQHGIPMGISVCVIAANIFVGSLFAPVFYEFVRSGQGVVLFRAGYVDDGLAIVDATPHALSSLITNLGTVHPSISITTVVSTTHAVFLDLVVSKGARWESSGHTLLDTRVHTKPNNLHLYIPHISCHPRGAVSGFISGEARRFVCLCSTHEDATAQCLAFARALHARGYPLDTIVEELCKIDYHKRSEYLRLTHSDPDNPACDDTRVVAFVLPYTPTTASWNVGQALRLCFDDIPHLSTVMAWQNAPNLQHTLGLRNLKPTSPAAP
jgi:hypothetical protein